MKITQEVRDFAAKQEAGLINSPSVRPELVDGRGRKVSEADAEAGMAEMSEKYRAAGKELYIGAGGRAHD
jgi:phosphomethylpyrimidine synthase